MFVYGQVFLFRLAADRDRRNRVHYCGVVRLKFCLRSFTYNLKTLYIMITTAWRFVAIIKAETWIGSTNALCTKRDTESYPGPWLQRIPFQSRCRHGATAPKSLKEKTFIGGGRDRVSDCRVEANRRTGRKPLLPLRPSLPNFGCHPRRRLEDSGGPEERKMYCITINSFWSERAHTFVGVSPRSQLCVYCFRQRIGATDDAIEQTKRPIGRFTFLAERIIRERV